MEITSSSSLASSDKTLSMHPNSLISSNYSSTVVPQRVRNTMIKTSNATRMMTIHLSTAPAEIVPTSELQVTL